MDKAPATFVLAGLTALVSLAILAFGALPWAALGGGFIPVRLDDALLPADHGIAAPVWLAPLTATLIHGGGVHLALNMVMLVYCGRLAEHALGAQGIAMLYLVGAYTAAAGHWLFASGSTMPMIGASGAISAIVAAYALLYGQRRATAIGPVPAGIVHVAWLAAAWIGIQLLIGFAGLGGGPGAIAIGAHIGGFLAGLVLARPLLLLRWRGA